MAVKSASLQCCVLPSTTPAMGPITDAFAVTPTFKSAVMSLIAQSPSPASTLDTSDGAYQFCSGMSPPARSGPAVAPRALRAAWQALQWPRPLTRYAPRLNSAFCAASFWYTPGLKYNARHTASAICELYGKRTVCAVLACFEAGTLARNANNASESARVTSVVLVYGKAGYSKRPFFDLPLCMARQKS